MGELVKPLGGLRHALDPKVHATFFQALAMYFNEEDACTKVKKEIEALNSEPLSFMTCRILNRWGMCWGQTTKSARLVEWLADKADCLQDPKFGLVNSPADADREKLDVEMSRQQALKRPRPDSIIHRCNFLTNEGAKQVWRCSSSDDFGFEPPIATPRCIVAIFLLLAFTFSHPVLISSVLYRSSGGSSYI